jgi:hypothetical protein
MNGRRVGCCRSIDRSICWPSQPGSPATRPSQVLNPIGLPPASLWAAYGMFMVYIHAVISYVTYMYPAVVCVRASRTHDVFVYGNTLLHDLDRCATEQVACMVYFRMFVCIHVCRFY